MLNLVICLILGIGFADGKDQFDIFENDLFYPPNKISSNNLTPSSFELSHQNLSNIPKKNNILQWWLPQVPNREAWEAQYLECLSFFTNMHTNSSILLKNIEVMVAFLNALPQSATNLELIKQVIQSSALDIKIIVVPSFEVCIQVQGKLKGLITRYMESNNVKEKVYFGEESISLLKGINNENSLEKIGESNDDKWSFWSQHVTTLEYIECSTWFTELRELLQKKLKNLNRVVWALDELGKPIPNQETVESALCSSMFDYSTYDIIKGSYMAMHRDCLKRILEDLFIKAVQDKKIMQARSKAIIQIQQISETNKRKRQHVKKSPSIQYPNSSKEYSLEDASSINSELFSTAKKNNQRGE